jgi:long-chain fatty acid transport protein
MRRSAVLCAAGALAVIVLAPEVRAQGFSVYEHDACTMARGATGVAAPCDQASAVFFNPAAIIGGATRFNLEANLTLIAPTGSFTDSATRAQTDLNKRTFPVPAGYLTYQLTQRLAVGVGAFAPYGLTTDWPTGGPGRYLAYKTSIASFYVQPTVAYAITRQLQVGVGVDYVHSSAQVHRRVDASTLPVTGFPVTLGSLGVPVGTDMADVLFDVSGSGWGGHAGVLFKANDRLSFGARYLSRVKIDFTGTASFTQVATGIVLPAGNPFQVPGGTPLDAVLATGFAAGQPLSNQRASTTISMPDQIIAGVAFKVMPTLTVLADWQHTWWSSFDTLNLKLAVAPSITEPENYKDTDAFRFGVDYQATPTVAIRGGALYHNGASPDQSVTPLLPEGNRVEGTLGAGINLTPRLRLDLAYQYLQQQDRRGRMIDPPAGTAPTPLLNHGLYTFKANLFGASLALGF